MFDPIELRTFPLESHKHTHLLGAHSRLPCFSLCEERARKQLIKSNINNHKLYVQINDSRNGIIATEWIALHTDTHTHSPLRVCSRLFWHCAHRSPYVSVYRFLSLPRSTLPTPPPPILPSSFEHGKKPNPQNVENAFFPAINEAACDTLSAHLFVWEMLASNPID